jgi:lipopolysaccharide export system ATP-binding protein
LTQLNEWAKQLHVFEVLHKKAALLSGGQKRKIEIIRALLMQPLVLLLDEPFAGVDPKSIEELQELFQALVQKNIGILISDHHVFQLLAFADYSYVLFQGTIVASGLSEEIVHNNRIQEIYLGKKFVYLQ